MTDDEYELKLARIEWLMSTNPPPGSKDERELQALAEEVEAFEKHRFPLQIIEGYEVNVIGGDGEEEYQVASASGPNAATEALRYAHGYTDEGDVVVYRVVRTVVARLVAKKP